MKLRRQQQIERELNGYRAWIDKAGKAGRRDGTACGGLHGRRGPPSTSLPRGSLDRSRERL